MRSNSKTISINRRLIMTMSLLVLGAALAMTISGWFLFLSPSVERIAISRMDRVGTIVRQELDRLFQQTERLLLNTESWIGEDDAPLDYQLLNRHFIPLLKQYPEFSLALIAERSGREWMLKKQADGTWLNQLTPPADDDKESSHFLTWQHASKLITDETRQDDYDPRTRPWFQAAMQAPPGTPVWTKIYSFYDDNQPGVTAAIRIKDDTRGDLVFALDLRLRDMADYLARIEIGKQGLAVLLTDDAYILGMTHNSNSQAPNKLQDLIFQPADRIDHVPLKQGVKLWMDGGREQIHDAHMLVQGRLWHLGFRKFHLGNRNLWLGIYLPASELIPGFGYQLLVLGTVLLLVIGLVIGLAIRFTRAFCRPLERLAANSLRMGDLDFAPPPPIQSDLREIRQLANAQEQMRSMLKDAHEKLLQEHLALQAAQSRLIHAAKMESVGRLAAGVAHEVKNPLAIIQMGLDFLKGENAISDTAVDFIGSMELAIGRADGVVKGLLDFSRERELDLVPADLNQVIHDSLDLVRHELQQHNITLSEALAPLPSIHLDRDKLCQVFINLFMNAIQSMGKDGTLTISSETRKLSLDSELEMDRSGRFSTGQQVIWIQVRDTGPGIEAEQLERLFDPFFTTKEVGKGTGLGLSVSRSIIELHRGSIDIRNHPQGGASATLLFKLEGETRNEDKNPAGG